MKVEASIAYLFGALLFASPVVAADAPARSETRAVQSAHQRFVPLEAGRNFRDLGGYKTADGRQVKWGLIYRSGTMHRLTAGDFATLKRLGVRSIVDFRSTEERRLEPFAPPASLDLTLHSKDYDLGMPEIGRSLAGLSATPDQMRVAVQGFYRRIPFEFADQYREMFAQLLSGRAPLVINCSAGKDRTGVAAALLLTALGVPRATIMQDYLLSNPEFQPKSAQSHAPSLDPRMSQLSPALAQMLVGVEAVSLDAALAAIESRAGGMDGYLRNDLSLSAADIKRLKSLYLQ